MKALVYTQPCELELQERPRPQAASGEVVLKIDAVGVCGSDMHAWHGKDPRRQPGLVLGHEFVGTVVESTAPGFDIGTRFTGNPLVTCGVCDFCVQGRTNLCTDRTMIGMSRPGAFAEFMSIPASSLIAIPEGMEDATAALTEPAATAWHAVNLSLRVSHRPIHEARVLVLGGGAIGMLAALLLRHLGVIQLTVSEPNAGRRDAVQRHVGCEVMDPRTGRLDEGAYDYVFDAVGAAPTRNQAMAAVRAGGVVVHVGLQDWASEIDMRKLTLSEITLLGAYTYTTADLRATVSALHAGAFGDLAWVQQRPLHEGPAVFREIDHGQCSSAKVLLVP